MPTIAAMIKEIMDDLRYPDLAASNARTYCAYWFNDGTNLASLTRITCEPLSHASLSACRSNPAKTPEAQAACVVNMVRHGHHLDPLCALDTR
eukprot:EC791041.1.p1 GENE.EC791041.1~~EC791041.1.p1  ORF type:complete len:93 (-),score=4.51 EC791041.1:31-309(-)